MLYREAFEQFCGIILLSFALILFQAFFNINSIIFNKLFSPRINALTSQIPSDNRFSGITEKIVKLQNIYNTLSQPPGFIHFVSVIFLIVIGLFTLFYLIVPLFKLRSLKQGVIFLAIGVGVGFIPSFFTPLYAWAVPFIIMAAIQTGLLLQPISP